MQASDKEVLDKVKSYLLAVLSEAFDAMQRSQNAIEVIAWVETQRMHLIRQEALAAKRGQINPLVSITNSTTTALLSSCLLALVEVGRERGNRLDDYLLYRNAALARFNELAKADMQRWPV